MLSDLVLIVTTMCDRFYNKIIIAVEMVQGKQQQSSFSSGLSRIVTNPAQGQNISTQTLDSMDLTDTDVAL